MAEINVQRKSTTSWPLILLGLLVVLLVGWWFLTPGDDESVVPVTPTAEVAEPVQTPETDVTAEVTPLSAWLSGPATQLQVGPDHEYVSAGLHALADALEARAPEGMALEDRARDIRERADAIQRETRSTEHANMVRDAFQTAAAVIGDMRTHYPAIGEAATRVEAAASSVQRDVVLLEQQEAIRNFFREASDALSRARADG